MFEKQLIGQKCGMKLANRSFEGMAEFKYLGTTVTEQYWLHEEINSRLNSGNACYRLVQSLLSSCLLSMNLKVKIYKTIILPVVLCGCESWSLTLREKHCLRVFGPERDEEWRKLHSADLHNLLSSPDIVRWKKSR
jgi:hypothetical protein